MGTVLKGHHSCSPTMQMCTAYLQQLQLYEFHRKTMQTLQLHKLLESMKKIFLARFRVEILFFNLKSKIQNFSPLIEQLVVKIQYLHILERNTPSLLTAQKHMNAKISATGTAQALTNENAVPSIGRIDSIKRKNRFHQ